MQQIGALCFGAVIGWVTYYTLRYSKSHALSDVATVIGAVGGGAVVALFPAQSNLFGFYGIGLSVGFFLYVLILLVAIIKKKSVGGILEEGDKNNPIMGGE